MCQCTCQPTDHHRLLRQSLRLAGATPCQVPVSGRGLRVHMSQGLLRTHSSGSLWSHVVCWQAVSSSFNDIILEPFIITVKELLRYGIGRSVIVIGNVLKAAQYAPSCLTAEYVREFQGVFHFSLFM